jgi:hypothetical protein
LFDTVFVYNVYMKSFEIAAAQKENGEDYHAKLLHIINDINVKVRAVEPDARFHAEIHEKRRLDATKEIEEFQEIRQDVCDSFGVTNDDDHVYLYRGPGVGEQRAMRAFFVLIDSLSKESFYGEGRIDHITLFRNLASKLKKIDGKSDFETITQSMEDESSLRYLVFKGFLSTKEFQELSDSSRKILETPIIDEKGQKVETPSTWFVTGHNIPEHI